MSFLGSLIKRSIIVHIHRYNVLSESQKCGTHSNCGTNTVFYKYGGQRTYKLSLPLQIVFGSQPIPTVLLNSIYGKCLLTRSLPRFVEAFLYFSSMYYVWDCSTWGRFSESWGSTPLVSLPFPSIQFMEACSDPILGSFSLLDLLLPTLRSPPFNL